MPGPQLHKKDRRHSSPGNHNHDGTNSVKLLAGVTITGTTNLEKINSIIAALVKLGATDATT